MNPIIESISERFFKFYLSEREQLAKLPPQQQEDLNHLSNDLRRAHNSDYIIRVAAEIVYAATTVNLKKQ